MENELPVTSTITLGNKDATMTIENEQPVIITQSENSHNIQYYKDNNMQHYKAKTTNQNNNPKALATSSDGLPYEMPSLFG